MKKRQNQVLGNTFHNLIMGEKLGQKSSLALLSESVLCFSEILIGQYKSNKNGNRL